MQEVSVVFLNENKQGYEKFKPIDKDTAGEFNPSDETIRINIFYQGNERTLEEVQYILGMRYHTMDSDWRDFQEEEINKPYYKKH